MKANLCFCNNCNSVLIDENPQTGAVEFELKGTEATLKFINIGNDSFFGCPVCIDDAYLIDLENKVNHDYKIA